MNLTEEIRNLYQDYRGGLDKALYVLSDIPNGKLARAKKKYAPVPPTEVVLMLLDNTLTGGTVLGSAKEGLIMTSETLYYYDKGWDRYAVIPIKDISTVNNSDTTIEFLVRDETMYFYPYGFNKALLAEFLNQSIEIIKKSR